MRILIVGHTYIVRENQKKLAALAARPAVELALVVPRRWRDDLIGTVEAHVEPSAPFATTAVPVIFPGREQFYLYRSMDIGLRRFQPDVLCVEQGAGSLVYAQSLVYRNLYSRRAKAVFFTWWNLPYRASWPLAAVERFNLSQSAGAIAGNGDAAGVLRDHGFTGPLLVLPQLGVDPAAFAPRPSADVRRHLGLDRFTVGFVGRLVEEKGIFVLLRALSLLAGPWNLLLLGRGPATGEVMAAVAAHGWADRVRLVDAVRHDEVPQYLNAMDVLVLPSFERPPWKEQFGHVLVEAMACGVAVIGSACGEIPKVIGDAGSIVPQHDAPALAAAIARLQASPVVRAEVGQAGRRRVLDHYTHERIAARLLDFFRSL